MDIVLDGLAGDFFRGGEHRRQVDIEADVGEGGGHHLGAAVVTVLAHLAHQHARPAAVLLNEGFSISAAMPCQSSSSSKAEP